MFLHPDAARFLEMTADAPPLDTLTVEHNRADVDATVPLTLSLIHISEPTRRPG